ncbi:hypothetical protein Caka_3100 [Coraliomargarita akajimensis DSM 45221]|uniref:Type II secretion system protein GspG C-terminal domain-containing protein n=2 Tax=Coraliomargarita TaxID=442430 RepID=D5EI73_CORAD|nr:hypothetical protein Caka_3100 [Coraliomargarita akajimensis DSM 45221]
MTPTSAAVTTPLRSTEMKLLTSLTFLILLYSQALGNTQKPKKVAITQSNVAELRTAIERYRSAYSQYPPLEEAKLLVALNGKIDKTNPNGLPFWSPKKEKKILWWTRSHGVVNSQGRLIDGWGRQFYWSVSDNQQTLRLTSKGKNGVFDTGKAGGDDLYFTLIKPIKQRSIESK